jgi:4a-hydroxytetrahydrobiopterin dehydratase
MLSKKSCIPCKEVSSEHLLKDDVVLEYLSRVKDWKLSIDAKSIQKEFTFSDFLKAMSFVDTVADVAQEADHHPDIHIWYNKVKLELSTHSIGGLTENDFIVAARIDDLWLI